MRVLALIAARKGSKGLRDKNVLPFAGKPLLVRAIELAHASARRGEHWTVAVTTDAPRYARLAEAAGAEVVGRPQALASDEARLIDAVLHAVAELEDRSGPFDAVVLLSAVTPLTRIADVRGALALFSKAASVASVTPDPIPDHHRFDVRGGVLQAESGRRVGRRQEGPRRFRLNGALYVAAPAWLRKYQQFLVPRKTKAFLMPKHRSLDIDDTYDLACAAALLLVK